MTVTNDPIAVGHGRGLGPEALVLLDERESGVGDGVRH
jgi:hypothetical protein